MKKALQNKSPGFRLTLVTMLLSIVTICVYIAIYSSTNYMSWGAVGVMIAGLVLTCVLILTRQYRFAPTALLVGDYMGFLFFAHAIYFYISSVITGIQFSGFPLSFYVNIVFFSLTIALCIACVFLRQTPAAETSSKGGKRR